MRSVRSTSIAFWLITQCVRRKTCHHCVYADVPSYLLHARGVPAHTFLPPSCFDCCTSTPVQMPVQKFLPTITMPITHQNGLGPSKYKLPLFTGLQQVVQSRKDNGIWRKPPTNHFCSLPLEIRDEIYAYLLKLGPNRPVRHRLDRRPQMPPLLLHGMHVQIFRVNHQIYEEAIPVMWRANQFVKISSNDPNFLVVLGQTPILGMSTGPDG